MSIAYDFHSAYPDSILVRKFEGDVNVDEIIESWEFLLTNEILTTNIVGVINDLTSCKLIMNLNGFKKLMEFLKSKDEFKKIKLAVITENPQNIIFPTIGKLKVKELMIKPFATEPAAVKWIVG